MLKYKSLCLLKVVLLTSGLDLRPFQLAWPSGTIIFLVGSAGDHATSRAAGAAGLKVPDGCLLRRVAADLKVDRLMQLVSVIKS